MVTEQKKRMTLVEFLILVAIVAVLVTLFITHPDLQMVTK